MKEGQDDRITGWKISDDHIDEIKSLGIQLKEKDDRHNKLISEHANAKKYAKKLETEKKEQEN